ncbi:hypothetical protein SCHPADRAFT_946553 [Schizopora paradoxa]|uniref:F-box domain-containing protein n=1 Tax=Schizopora paradoxa TaxID=27342 RepID=A0A0H2R245_9AGAM|nr:hypothetical protein SCHPADRAFT_946553 [Schizopora paradoxa]
MNPQDFPMRLQKKLGHFVRRILNSSLRDNHQDTSMEAPATSSSSKGVRFKWFSTATRRKRATIESSTESFTLPFDILVEVAKHLDIPDLLSLCKVSRSFISLANSQAVWDEALRNYVLSCRPLVVGDSPVLFKLSLQDLRTALLRSHRLFTNWESKSPTQVASPTLVTLKQSCDVGYWESAFMPYVLSGNYMTVSCRDSVVCIRLPNGSCITFRKSSRVANPFLFPHSESSSLYVVTADRQLANEAGPKSYITIKRILLPPARHDAGDAELENIQEIPLPAVRRVEKACADTARRRICVLCPHPSRSPNVIMIMLIVVLDWNDKTCALVDFEVVNRGTFVGISTHFTDDGKGLIVTSRSQALHWQYFDIADLYSRAFAAGSYSNSPVNSIPPTHSGSYIFQPNIYSDNFSLMWSQLIDQPWRGCLGMTSLASSVYVLFSYGSANTLKYRVVQYYITKDGPLGSHFSADLQTCAIVPGLGFPMLAVSFSHFCWIAEVFGPEFWGARLELRIARFPPPHERQWRAQDHVRKVDVPKAVLEHAQRIFLAPSKASILILTSDRKLRTFRYA